MMKLLALICAVFGSHSVAIKVSVRFAACENYLSEKIVRILDPEGCLHIYYPERDGNDVAILTQGITINGSYFWNAPLDRTADNSLKIRSDQENMQLTFYNHDTGKEQTVKNLENGQEFEIIDHIMSEEATSKSLEEVTRFFDETKDGNVGVLKIHVRQADDCGDVYEYQAICPTWAEHGGCENPVIVGWCQKSCGLCGTTKPPSQCTPLAKPTTTCTTPFKNISN